MIWFMICDINYALTNAVTSIQSLAIQSSHSLLPMVTMLSFHTNQQIITSHQLATFEIWAYIIPYVPRRKINVDALADSIHSGCVVFT
jgi:hypothetical protein